MKQISDILEKMRNFLFDPEFRSSYAVNKKHFVRRRVFTIQLVFCFVLNLLRKSIAIELLNFSIFLNVNVSKSAITKARSKLSPLAFKGLNRILVKEFYTDIRRTFRGFTLIAIDGMLLELPLNSPQILRKYGGATNQTAFIKPMARSSSAFDVLNGITLDAILAPYNAAERDLAIRHIENINDLDLGASHLYLFDRGYPSLELMICTFMNNHNFLMRCNTKFIKEVNEAVRLGKTDCTIKFKAKGAKEAWKSLTKKFPSLELTDSFSLRVIVVKLKTGEREILLTSLLDRAQYPKKIFKDLYFKRWGIEGEYGFKKGSMEIENFSGKSCVAVEQDFHATILVGNVCALLAYEAQDETLEKSVSGKKYDYKINKNVGISMLKETLIEALLCPSICLKTFTTRIKQAMQRNIIPIRPGRSRPRRKVHLSQKCHMSRR